MPAYTPKVPPKAPAAYVNKEPVVTVLATGTKVLGPATPNLPTFTPPQDAVPAEVVKRKPHTEPQPWMVKSIYELMRLGHTVETAARVMGVSPKRLAGWIAEGEKDTCSNDLLLELAHSANTGRGKVVGTLLSNQMLHAQEHASANQWALERLAPEFQVTKKAEIKHETGADASHQLRRVLSILTDEQIAQLEAEEDARLASGE